MTAAAGTIVVDVTASRGFGVRDAVVFAVPVGREMPLVRRTAAMDQKNRMFIPHVLVVQTGTAVQFPNSDDIHHHVYSFSPTKPFQLPLYKGTPANPIVFDRAGVATIGCNIHDRMSAFIVVVDTPYFAKVDLRGRGVLMDLDSGIYDVHVWYPEIRSEPEPARITVNGNGSRYRFTHVAGSAEIKAANAE